MTGIVASMLIVATTASAGAEPVARHTPADMQRARQLVLERSDLGNGWVTEPTPSGTAGTTASTALRCAGYDPDLSGIVETGSAAGASFSFDDGHAFYSVGSAATVMQTTAMTARAWEQSVRPAIVSCFRSAFVRGLQLGAGAGATAAPRVTFGAAREFTPSTGAHRAAGFRVTATILFRDRGATPLPIVIDVVFLSQGRHLSFATIASLGDRPPASLERTVTARLANHLRARAGARTSA